LKTKMVIMKIVSFLMIVLLALSSSAAVMAGRTENNDASTVANYEMTADALPVSDDNNLFTAMEYEMITHTFVFDDYYDLVMATEYEIITDTFTFKDAYDLLAHAEYETITDTFTFYDDYVLLTHIEYEMITDIFTFHDDYVLLTHIEYEMITDTFTLYDDYVLLARAEYETITDTFTFYDDYDLLMATEYEMITDVCMSVKFSQTNNNYDDLMGRGDTSAHDSVEPTSTTLTINPSTNWTNIPAAGGTRTVSVSTNAPSFTVNRPTWMNPTAFITGGFRISAPVNNTTSARTGTITVNAGGLSRSFSVSQVAGAATLTINPSTNWTNIPAAGGTRTVSVSTNAPSFTVNRPTWMNPTEFITGGFRISAPVNNTTSARTGTITVNAGGLSRSFSVSQVAGAATLTINPSTNWTNIPSEGGTMHQRSVTVTTNATSFTVSSPSWLNIVYSTGTTRGFRLTPRHNTTISSRSGTVTVTAGNQTRSFTVSQSPGPLSLRNGTGTFYMQAQGKNLFLQGSNVRTRNLPSQQWQVSFQTTINGNRYYRLSQGGQILAVTVENIHGHTVGMTTAGALSHVNRGLWRFEHVGNYHYRIVNRWTADNGWVAALTSATTNGGAVTLQTRGGANQLWYIRNRANFLHNRTERPYPWRVFNRTFSVYLCRTSVQGSGWEQAIRDGILAWNVSSGNRDAGVNISLRTTGAQTPHMFEVQTRNSLNPDTFGTISYVRMSSGNIIEHSTSRIYAARINEYVRDTSMSALNVARSVAAHEVGHMFGLGDNPPQFTSSIMHGRRTRHTVTSHNAFDARNVRIMYGAQ